MIEENRWTIQELLARYELEPELMDVFVEGTFDKDVLTQAATEVTVKPIFYEIDVVDVSVNLLAKYGLTLGNKQRIIALAKELDSLPQKAKVFCIADRDLDHWFDNISNTNRLRWSVFCSLECHFLTQETANEVILIAGRSKIKQFDVYSRSLIEVLRQLYALRLTDKSMRLCLTWVALKKYLARTNDSAHFDVQKYISALLGSNKKASQQKAFSKTYDNWLQKLDCDIRLATRGHDYLELVAWTLSEFNGQKEFATEAAVARLFVLLARQVPSINSEYQ